MISSHKLKNRDFYLNKLIGFQGMEPVNDCRRFISLRKRAYPACHR